MLASAPRPASSSAVSVGSGTAEVSVIVNDWPASGVTPLTVTSSGVNVMREASRPVKSVESESPVQ